MKCDTITHSGKETRQQKEQWVFKVGGGKYGGGTKFEKGG